jgi:hypothetical protein
VPPAGVQAFDTQSLGTVLIQTITYSFDSDKFVGVLHIQHMNLKGGKGKQPKSQSKKTYTHITVFHTTMEKGAEMSQF